MDNLCFSKYLVAWPGRGVGVLRRTRHSISFVKSALRLLVHLAQHCCLAIIVLRYTSFVFIHPIRWRTRLIISFSSCISSSKLVSYLRGFKLCYVIGTDYVYVYLAQLACGLRLRFVRHSWSAGYFGMTWDTRVCIAFRAGGCSSWNRWMELRGLGTSSRLCFD